MDALSRCLLAAISVLTIAVSPALPAASVSYSYDANNRVTRAAYSDGSVVSFTYDAAGNIVTKTVASGSPVAPLNATGLWWNPNESGWGINFSHQADIVFATWFTYDASGKPWWLIAQLEKSGSAAFAGPVSTVVGPPWNSVPFDSSKVAETGVGTATLTFANAGSANFAYTVNGKSQTKAIVPQEFPKRPTCVWGAQPDLTTATNYTDLWWKASESGWGINFSHQGNTIFATWFTYDAAGKPWWLIAQLEKTAGGVYAGPVSTVVGSPWDSVPFDSSKVVETVVGNATATFANGNSATFAYTVNGTTQSKAITRQVFAPPGTVCQ